MTRKDLLSTGVLDCGPKDFMPGFTCANWRYVKNLVADEIVLYFPRIAKTTKYQDPAKEYLEKLRKDLGKLSRLETNNNLIKPIENEMKIKGLVCERYINLFRKQFRKELGTDFFILHIYNMLEHIKYKKRIEILSYLYLLRFNPPTQYTDWKISRKADYWEKESANISQRLKRITDYYETRLSKDARLRNTEEIYLSSATAIQKQYENNKSRHSIESIKKNRKRVARHHTLVRYLIRDLDKNRGALPSSLALTISAILQEHKVSAPKKMLNSIIHDPEFVAAFRLPLPQ